MFSPSHRHGPDRINTRSDAVAREIGIGKGAEIGALAKALYYFSPFFRSANRDSSPPPPPAVRAASFKFLGLSYSHWAAGELRASHQGSSIFEWANIVYSFTKLCWHKTKPQNLTDRNRCYRKDSQHTLRETVRYTTGRTIIIAMAEKGHRCCVFNVDNSAVKS